MANTQTPSQQTEPTSGATQAESANGPAEARSFQTEQAQPQAAQGAPYQALAPTVGREADTWRAFDPFLSLQFDVNRWFDDLWRQTTGLSPFPALRTGRPFAGPSQGALFGLPAADIKEGDKAYRITVELPGLKPAEVDVNLRQDAIAVTGHKQEETDDSASAYRVSERRYGRFERTFPLPRDVDRAHIEATFKDGVLKLTLPKTESAAPQSSRIEIRS